MVYFVNVTIIWFMFLLLHLLAFKHQKQFTFNRFYLLFSLVAGLVIPRLPFPGLFPAEVNRELYTPLWNQPPGEFSIHNEQAASYPDQSAFDFTLIFWLLYIPGAIVVLYRLIREIVWVQKLKKSARKLEVSGRCVYATRKEHAPFSYFHQIYISDQEDWNPPQLEMILKHEKEHVRQKHWVDNGLVSLLGVLFWFHPFIWLYKKLIRINHEYQADEAAASDSIYEYGTLLLLPFSSMHQHHISNSFHFSPIKNRINMLTKTTSTKRFLKLTALIPLFLSGVVMAAQQGNEARVRKGNVTTFKGNSFEWDPGFSFIDTIKVRKSFESEETRLDVIERHTGEYVVQYNNEPVERAVILDLKENKMTAFEQQITDFSEQLTADFKKQADFDFDKIASIQIQKMVLDKNGNILYFEPFIMPMENGEPESVIGKEVYLASLDLVDQLIQNYGKIKMDERYAGKNIFIDYFGVIRLNERVFQVKLK